MLYYNVYIVFIPKTNIYVLDLEYKFRCFS